MDIIVDGLSWGDETKGSTVDFLSYHLGIDTVVRFNGGCQAAHNVHIDSIQHTFSQFGSATFNQAKTILTKFMLIDPLRLLSEADMLINKGVTDALNRLIISENCVIITPLHRLLCRMKELSRSQRNGSVGLGVGEATADYKRGLCLKVKDLRDIKQAMFVFRGMWAQKIDVAEQLVESHPLNLEIAKMLEKFLDSYSIESILKAYQGFMEELRSQVFADDVIEEIIQSKKVIFEGAQGTLLDQTYGFFPYVTHSNCTVENAEKLTNKPHHNLGLSRVYCTRHGAGPFPTEADLSIFDKDNKFNPWQGEFRFGWLDLVMLRYAISVNRKIDSIGLSCVDHLSNRDQIKICTHYQYFGNDLNTAHRCFEFDPKNPRKLLNLKNPYPQGEILEVLPDCQPIYQEMASWSEFSHLNSPDDLPKELKEYIKYLEEQICVPISLISYGPDRQQKLFLREIISPNTPS